MNLIISAFTLILVVSCGHKNEEGGHTFSEVQTINREWTSETGSKFESIDLSDPNAVLIKNASRDSVFADCLYSSNIEWFNIYYGDLNLALISGDSFICSQFVGQMSFSAAFSNKRQREELNLLGFNYL